MVRQFGRRKSQAFVVTFQLIITMILSWIVVIDVVHDGSHRFSTGTSSLGRSGSSVVMVEFQLQWAFERTTVDRSRGSLEGKMCEIHDG